MKCLQEKSSWKISNPAYDFCESENMYIEKKGITSWHPQHGIKCDSQQIDALLVVYLEQGI